MRAFYIDDWWSVEVRILCVVATTLRRNRSDNLRVRRGKQKLPDGLADKVREVVRVPLAAWARSLLDSSFVSRIATVGSMTVARLCAGSTQISISFSCHSSVPYYSARGRAVLVPPGPCWDPLSGDRRYFAEDEISRREQRTKDDKNTMIEAEADTYKKPPGTYKKPR